MDLSGHLQTARRATVGKNALDALALLFLLASGAFWFVLHWSALVVPGAGLPQMVVAVVMTAIYALALPLLLSMLAPSTPAGMLLQKTQWRTWGFLLVIGSAMFLGFHARNLMLLWFSAQPVIEEAEQEAAYTIAAMIGFVVIPALAWVQATPEQWLSAIQQAHKVRKLEMEQEGEIAIIKARLLWAEERAAVSYASLLPAEQEEVRATLGGLLKGIADLQRDIANTVGARATVERSLGSLGDAEIDDIMSHIAVQLEKPAQALERFLPVYVGDADNARSDAPERTKPPQEDYTKSYEAMRTADRPRRSRTIPHEGEYTIAYERYGSEPWMVKDLATLLAIEPETAAKRRREWQQIGLVGNDGLSNGRYQFIDITKE